jgi:hypothetical protein
LHHRIPGWYGGFGLSEREPSNAHPAAQPPAHAHAHDHSHGRAHEHDEHGEDDDGEPTSTGFLPIGLAISLFVTGLFVLGFIPGVSCG